MTSGLHLIANGVHLHYPDPEGPGPTPPMRQIKGKTV